MKAILDHFGIDEQFTRNVHNKPKKFDHVKDNVPPHQYYNYGCDLLFMPEDKHGNRYCLVVVDLASDQFDIEPIKNKEAKTVLTAFKKMFKRPYIHKPYVSVRTDAGSEFQGAFHKYLWDENVLHSVALPNRHSQNANVENLNKQLGRIFLGYLNMKELETKKVYREWTDILDDVRKLLNKYKMKRNEGWEKREYVPPSIQPAKFDVGDMVYYRLDAPQDALGHPQPTKQFREGDFRYSPIAEKVTQVLEYPQGPRYILNDRRNVSYTENQLLKSDEKEQKWIVQKLLDKKTIKGKLHYLVKWKGFAAKDATWEPKTRLVEDGLAPLIDVYEQQLKDKKKSKKNTD